VSSLREATNQYMPAGGDGVGQELSRHGTGVRWPVGRIRPSRRPSPPRASRRGTWEFPMRGSRTTVRVRLAHKAQHGQESPIALLGLAYHSKPTNAQEASRRLISATTKRRPANPI
jgi:hypothetical protein